MSTLRSHVDEGDYRSSLLWAVGLHVALPLLVLATAWLLPVPVIEISGGASGSGGGTPVMTAVLTEDIGGGDGMVYQGLKPQPQVAPPPEEKPEPPPPPAEDQPVFVEKKSQPEPEKVTESNPNVRKPEPAAPREARAGEIPTEPKPGKPGPTGGTPGSGEGGEPGEGDGVDIGTGGGAGEVDSWYVRQVRQRVSRNWLRTSMGEVSGRVEAVVLFDVDAAGRIRNVSFESRSGVAAVDRAAERAVRASSPLPQPPPRFRRSLLRFRAVFVFPPR